LLLYNVRRPPSGAILAHPWEIAMSARAILIVLAALAMPAVSLAGPPDGAALLEGMMQAAGGQQAFRDLGVIEIALTEEETTANGTQHKKQSTAYVDAATLGSMRLELPGEVVVARKGATGWSTRAGVPDDRPQGSRMAIGTLNQRLFPLLLPFTAMMDGVRLGAIYETSFEGQPAWRVAVNFEEGFFITPSMAATWYFHIRKDNGALLAAEFLPPPGVRDVRSEGIRYRVLKQARSAPARSCRSRCCSTASTSTALPPATSGSPRCRSRCAGPTTRSSSCIPWRSRSWRAARTDSCP
jgi:hypothetical protein